MSVLGFRDPQDNIPGGFPNPDSNNVGIQNSETSPSTSNNTRALSSSNFSPENILYIFLQIPLYLLSWFLTIAVFMVSGINRFIKLTNFYDNSHRSTDHKSNFNELLNILSSESKETMTEDDTTNYNFGSIYNADNSIISEDNLQTSYTGLLNACKKQYKFGFIYLHDSLKDDSMSYVDNILCTEHFINMVKKYQALMWFGDVTKSEGLQAANNCKVRHFPFLGIVMIKQSNKIEMIARVEGSLSNYNPKKFENILKKNQHILIQLIQQQQNIEMQRLIREQQDSRFRNSLRRDQERDRERQTARETEQREAEIREQNERIERQQQAQRKRWLSHRLHLLRPEPTGNDNTSRVAIKLNNNERIIRKFDANVPIEEIYAFVELYQNDMIRQGVTNIPDTIPPENYVHQYNFKLISPIPSVELQPEILIKDSSAIFPSGNIIQEDLDSN